MSVLKLHYILFASISTLMYITLRFHLLDDEINVLVRRALILRYEWTSIDSLFS